VLRPPRLAPARKRCGVNHNRSSADRRREPLLQHLMNWRRFMQPPRPRSAHRIELGNSAGRGQCPLLVRSRHLRRKRSCPLYPRKRTCVVQLEMPAKGQTRTLGCLFDHLTGAGEQRRWHNETEHFGSLRLTTSSYLIGACIRADRFHSAHR
jgi:hypothetical protein